jgi:hypothetical protein
MNSLHDILKGDIIPESGVSAAVGRNTLDFPSPVVPLLDVHLRRAELHDDNMSGIVSYNADKEHLQLIPSNSGAQPITTAVYIDVFSNDSIDFGNLDSGGAATRVPLDLIRSRSSEEHFLLDAANDNVRIWASGSYEVTLRTSSDNTDVGTTRRTHRHWLERAENTGGWTEIDGSRAFSFHRQASNGENTQYSTVILTDIGQGHRIRARIATNVTGGIPLNQSTIPSGCSLTIRRLA